MTKAAGQGRVDGGGWCWLWTSVECREAEVRGRLCSLSLHAGSATLALLLQSLCPRPRPSFVSYQYRSVPASVPRWSRMHGKQARVCKHESDVDVVMLVGGRVVECTC